ncbi:hypothetical protein HanXRQr2_Chr06g0246581 [Helianthus annuus]|uniref:Uncharacterized protein n=1 Tax=Helianthus annuus TaxID=4232 RepID=A0A9K3NI82_HELAN|nr:hypothetical protein HanXRQr2_Chr06g0246581 [Helianthus annuus]
MGVPATCSKSSGHKTQGRPWGWVIRTPGRGLISKGAQRFFYIYIHPPIKNEDFLIGATSF